IGRLEERTGRNNNKYSVYIVPQDPWDLQNTIYKMACKRAQVAAVLNATAASDIFTQDVEDMNGFDKQPAREPLKKPQAQPRAQAPKEEKVIDVENESPFSPSDANQIDRDQQVAEIGQMFSDMSEGDDAKFLVLLKKYTAYEKDGKKFAGRERFLDVSDAAMKVTHHRVKKDWKEKYDY
ncbi:MAG: hypothetical protein JRE23_12530, partial [Deltaproteobacteria bacterium]|nr:hypothetical protein [Deltaproteobacteria bacterium]